MLGPFQREKKSLITELANIIGAPVRAPTVPVGRNLGTGEWSSLTAKELGPITGAIPSPRIKPRLYGPGGGLSQTYGANVPVVVRFPNSPGFSKHGFIQIGN